MKLIENMSKSASPLISNLFALFVAIALYLHDNSDVITNFLADYPNSKIASLAVVIIGLLKVFTSKTETPAVSRLGISAVQPKTKFITAKHKNPFKNWLISFLANSLIALTTPPEKQKDEPKLVEQPLPSDVPSDGLPSEALPPELTQNEVIQEAIEKTADAVIKIVKSKK